MTRSDSPMGTTSPEGGGVRTTSWGRRIRSRAVTAVSVLVLAGLVVVLPGRAPEQGSAPPAADSEPAERSVAQTSESPQPRRTAAPAASDRPTASADPDDARTAADDEANDQALEEEPAEPEATPEPALVERMLDELRDGRRTVDNPNAEAPAAVTAASRGDGFNPIGSVLIPAVGVEVEFASGVHDEIVERGPGHWPGTPLPGSPGNAVLSGHRTTFTKPFADLDRLAPGDEIVTTLGPHEEVVYAITETTIVPEAEYADFILQQPDEPDAHELTLFACHPKGSRTHRIIVQARAEAPPSTAFAPGAAGGDSADL